MRAMTSGSAFRPPGVFSTSRSTRSGCLMTSRALTQPPSDSPDSEHAVVPERVEQIEDVIDVGGDLVVAVERLVGQPVPDHVDREHAEVPRVRTDVARVGLGVPVHAVQEHERRVGGCPASRTASARPARRRNAACTRRPADRSTSSPSRRRILSRRSGDSHEGPWARRFHSSGPLQATSKTVSIDRHPERQTR